MTGVDVDRAFAAHMQIERRRRRWSQSDLADYLNAYGPTRTGRRWDQIRVSRLEHCLTPLYLDDAVAISSVLGFTIAELVRS